MVPKASATGPVVSTPGIAVDAKIPSSPWGITNTGAVMGQVSVRICRAESPRTKATSRSAYALASAVLVSPEVLYMPSCPGCSTNGRGSWATMASTAPGSTFLTACTPHPSTGNRHADHMTTSGRVRTR